MPIMLAASHTHSAAASQSGFRLLPTPRPNDPMNQPRNPLHGITLEQMLTELIDSLGWEAMGLAVPIRCFTHDPSIASSLKFLRRTPWARQKTEELYLHQRK